MNLARLGRLELPTNWFEASYSIQLSYRRVIRANLQPRTAAGKLRATHASPSSGFDVGSRKIFAFEQERLTLCLCESICKAIAKVKSCRMIALSVAAPGCTRDFQMSDGYRLQLNPRPPQQGVEFMPHCMSASTFQNHRGFQRVGNRHAARRCLHDRLGITPAIGLIEQNRQHRRTIDDHLGKP